jgi:hypothetical protein
MEEMTRLPHLTRHDVEATIVKHCWKDEGFRAEFVADPAGMFAKYLEVPAAELARIEVHQEETGSWHIVLPQKPAYANELSDQELERVAGGTTGVLESVVVTAVYATAVTVSAGGVTSAVVTTKENHGW